ncbi:granzyme M-like isoform X2 [Pseudopipra pipra]|uniref:granzyme M-like isoform X2 n=1 Tax=Pseudopipra pipra TaxID=415032 RepID=UPI00313A3176
MGARGCLGPLLLLLLPLPSAWAWLQPSIIGGHEAKPHSRPYMASLQFGGVHACGAALLHRHWVLTAAHCLAQGTLASGRVVVGLHSLRDRGAATQTFPIRAACPHPGYDPGTMENDLLLLQLEGTVTPGRARRPIGLSGRGPAAGATCSLAGWGLRGRGGLSPTLQELEVKVMDPRMCNNSRFWDGGIAPTMICFQGQPRGSAPAKVSVWGSEGYKALPTPNHHSWVWGAPGGELTPSTEARCPPRRGGGPHLWSRCTLWCHPRPPGGLGGPVGVRGAGGGGRGDVLQRPRCHRPLQATGRHLDREVQEMDPENPAEGLQVPPAPKRLSTPSYLHRAAPQPGDMTL